ncbi:MAG: leucine-rich repeat domain-containing protein [Paludibacteraceae bacterium]|nr:leucine-rich repeat domain-containing protein [Paludibacteraceae bacterium]
METNQENLISGTCGKNLTWFFNKEDGILTIKGSGEMYSYEKEPIPWDGYEIKKVVISQGVLNICPSAFEDCRKLESIEIPDTVTSIGDSAFADCLSLTSIKIPNSVTNIGAWAFLGCHGLTSIKIPNSIISIGHNAFYCESLTSIEIPNSVKSIGYRAFAECGFLTAIDVAKDNPNYCSENGVLFNKDKTTLIQYPACRYDERYYIPNSVTSINDGAFLNCWKLKNIIIPDRVESIGEYAFYDCNALVSITSKSIVPPKLLYDDAFDEVDKSIPIFVPKESAEAYKTAGGWREFTNIQPI